MFNCFKLTKILQSAMMLKLLRTVFVFSWILLEHFNLGKYYNIHLMTTRTKINSIIKE